MDGFTPSHDLLEEQPSPDLGLDDARSAHQITVEAVFTYLSGRLFIGDALRVLVAQQEGSEQAQHRFESLLHESDDLRPSLRLCIEHAIAAIAGYRESLTVLLGDLLVFDHDAAHHHLAALNQRARDVWAAQRRFLSSIRHQSLPELKAA